MRILLLILLALLVVALPGQPWLPQSDDLKTLRKAIESLLAAPK